MSEKEKDLTFRPKLNPISVHLDRQKNQKEDIDSALFGEEKANNSRIEILYKRKAE